MQHFIFNFFQVNSNQLFFNFLFAQFWQSRIVLLYIHKLRLTRFSSLINNYYCNFISLILKICFILSFDLMIVVFIIILSQLSSFWYVFYHLRIYTILTHIFIILRPFVCNILILINAIKLFQFNFTISLLLLVLFF